MISVLISPNEQKSELAVELERIGGRVLTWPRVELAPLDDQSSLDEAIQNLFGYDWLILKNPNAARFFLKRFAELRHETNELDGLRVCVIGDETSSTIRESEIHVDVEVTRADSGNILNSIERYVGGRGTFSRLNFLLPSARVNRENFENEFEELGTRVDNIITYRTTSDPQALAQLNALLIGGAIDFVVFRHAAEVREVARLFDTVDLRRTFHETQVICAGDSTRVAACDFGLNKPHAASDALPKSLIDLIQSTQTLS